MVEVEIVRRDGGVVVPTPNFAVIPPAPSITKSFGPVVEDIPRAAKLELPPPNSRRVKSLP